MVRRVLVTGAANIGKAGVATIVYKWGQAFDSETLVYDYLMQSGLPDEPYQSAIEKKGGIIYTCENKKRLWDVIKWVTEIIKTNNYKILHINSDSAYVAAAYIYAAKKANIESIYVHSHCTQIDDTNIVRRAIKVFLHKICKPYVCANTRMFLACSEFAGIWMFGRKNVRSSKYKTIYNGVEVEKYLYNPSFRVAIRHEMELQDKFVIVNIGRLSYQKNQEFLIKIFAKYYKEHRSSVLLIIGDGNLRDRLKKMTKEMNIEEAVVFAGLRNDIPKILSAADVLVMPSRFEGLPVTMVEAQMADLPCVVADTITREAKFTKDVIYVEGWCEEKWTDAIERIRVVERYKNTEEKQYSIFNISNAAFELQTILSKQLSDNGC